jgi:hypothetical protein
VSELPEHSAPDPVGLVLGALAFGAALGVAIQGLVTWTVRTLQQGPPSQAAPALTSAPALVLLLGTLSGIGAAGFACWRLLAPLRNPWRQAMLGLIAGLGSFALSLVTLPIDRALGRPGLLGLVLVAALACALIGRRLSLGRRPA